MAEFSIVLSMLTSIIIYGFWVILGGAALLISVLWYITRIKYNVCCEILDFDAANRPMIRKTPGGVFIHGRTRHKRFWFKKIKDYSVDPDKVEFIPGDFGFFEKLKAFFVKYGEKDIRPIHWNISKNPGISVNIAESDLNWAYSEFTRWDKIIFPNKLKEWLPWIGLFFIGTIFLIIAIVILQKFDVLEQVAVALSDAAKSMAQAQSGGVEMP